VQLNPEWEIRIHTDVSAHESDSPDALADIAYGDERKAEETGQSEIIITSKSESATGREREQVNGFIFDKVGETVWGRADVRCSNPAQAKRRYSRRSPCSHRACWTGTT
jgi:kinesin family protein C1